MRKEKYSCICIDDDKLFLNIISQFIENIGYLDLIDTFSNPMQAMVKIDQLHPEILFLDIDMPEIDAFKMIEAFDYNPIIIMISSHWEHVDKLKKMGVHAFITKPLREPEELSRIVKKVITPDPLGVNEVL